MNLIVNAHASVQPDIMLMRKCYLDGASNPAIDASFDLVQPRDANGVLYPKLSAALGNTACDVEITNSTLQDGVFRCSALSECEIECNDLSDENGVDQSNLLDFAKAATCTAEWFAHAYLLQNVFTIAIYLSINIARVVLVAGIVRVSWQWLNTGYFAYRATCTRDGTHTYDKEELADKVDGLLSWIRLYGALMILIALGLQVPWIVALNGFAEGLIFSSASGSNTFFASATRNGVRVRG